MTAVVRQQPSGAQQVHPTARRRTPRTRRRPKPPSSIPAPGRRLPDLPQQVSRAGAEGRRQRADAAARQPGLAHPCRQAAGAGAGRPAVQHPAQPRRRGEHRGQGDPVGLHLALCAQGEPRAQSVPRPAGRLRDQLFPRLREADAALPRADGPGARRARGSRSRCWRNFPSGTESEAIQFEVYEVGKRHGWAKDLRAWFKSCYEVLFGTEQGPRLGSFIALYGVPETVALIRKACRELAGAKLCQSVRRVRYAKFFSVRSCH